MDSNLRCGLLDHTILWIIRSYGKLHPGLLSNFHWCHPLYSEAACLCMISVSYVLTRSFSLLSWELMTHTVLRMMTSTRGITLSLDYTIVKTYWNFLYTCYCHIFLPERPRSSKILLHFLNKIPRTGVPVTILSPAVQICLSLSTFFKWPTWHNFISQNSTGN